jgi:hypothetical protein
MAVLQYKFDESFEDGCMSIGGWLGEEKEWRRLELQWEKRLNYQNANSMPNQQITRFHAANMNAYAHEFEHWSKEMSENFCAALLRILSRRSIGMISCGVDINALKAEFPDGDEASRKERAYGFLIKNVMVDLGRLMREVRPGDQVMLVHDHGDWDATALSVYNDMVDDKRWASRHVFHSITPLTWKQSVGLQAADLAAYETFRVLKSKLATNQTTMRYALRHLVAQEMPMIPRYIDRRALKALVRVIKENRKTSQSPV